MVELFPSARFSQHYMLIASCTLMVKAANLTLATTERAIVKSDMIDMFKS
ncbi:hypothetical protein ES332_D01G039000v1 [Gossypium tomentosum]|uniref:Uncharacterized protein n=1 Tax=Gossypium tomentosum TaxID=34277 RepID=A0A5D2M532_GOSTO|nr:hypothetical protein ES332_D01G039000v1 [Gossypium tomentosum]